MNILNYLNWKQLNEQENKYSVTGYKFGMFGSYRVDIKAVDTKTGEVVISKGGEGESEDEAYTIAADAFNKAASKLGLEAPRKEELKETE